MSHHHHRADEKAKKLARKLEEQEEESQQLDDHDPTSNARTVGIDERRDEYAASTFGGLKDYKARKRRKLHNQSTHQHAATSPSTAHPRLFHAHTIHITGHTAPPARELAALITAHGGLFARHLDGKTAVTHIVAAGLPHKKRQELARYRVVRPEWVVDSVAAGKVRPWADYRLLEEMPGQGKLRAFGGPSGGGGSGSGSGGRTVAAAGQKTDGASGRKGGSGWPAGSSLSRGVTIPASDGEEDIDDEEEEEEEEEVVLLPPPNTAFTNPPATEKPAPVSTVNGTPLWSADSIIGRRMHRRQRQYWIRWTGYPDDEATWESERFLLRDIGKLGLAELLQEWRGKPQRRVGRAEVLREVPKEALMAFTVAREDFPRDYEVAEVEAAFAGEGVGAVAKSEPEEGAAPPPPEGLPGDPYREIRDGLSPHNLLSKEDELALFQSSIFSDGNLSAPAEAADGTPPSWQVPVASDTASAPAPPKRSSYAAAAVPVDLLEPIYISSDINLTPTPPTAAAAAAVEKAAETPLGGSSGSVQVFVTPTFAAAAAAAERAAETPLGSSSASVQVSRSFDYGSPVDFAALVADQEVVVVEAAVSGEVSEEEDMAVSFNFGTPVDFGDGDVGVFTQADPRPASVTERLEEEKAEGGEGEENVPWGIEGFVDDASLPDEIEDLIGKESTPEETMGLVSGHEEEGRREESTPRNTGSVEAADEAGTGGRGFTGTGTVDSDIESAGDIHMSQAELLTPREELEEYDARVYEDLDPPSPSGSPGREVSEHLSPGQHSPNISAGEREEPKEPEEQEEVDVEPPPGQGTKHPSPQQPSQELMAAFLSKPGIRSQTVLDPNFLNSYFSHSRLHHLSTWKSKIRLDLAPHLLTLAPKKNRPRHYILHADLDSFFASVSLLTRPELATKPVAIAHGAHDSTGGSEIAACNYPARSFGLKAGMWMSRAKALCPELTVLGYEFAQYEAASCAFYGVVKRVGAERIHAGSVDEVLLDVSNLVCDADGAVGSIAEEEARVLEIAEGVRRDVRAATGGLEVSVGVGGNVLLAKLALRRAKPAGVCLVRAAEVASFMDGVEVGELPGVGPSVVARVVEAFGTVRVAEIRAVSRERLRSVLGEKTGLMLWQYCRGVDGRVVGEVAVRKSLSVDVNWGVRFETAAQSEHFLHQLSAEVATRLHSERLHGRHLTLTIKQRSPHAPFKPAKHLGHGECTTLSKSTLLPAPTANASAIGNAAVVMLRAMKVPAWELRGLGLTLTKLQAAGAGTETGVGAGQGLLKFTKADPVAEGSSSRNEATAANVPPWSRPLPKPYTRPKPASLLDSFLKKPPPVKTPARPESHQPEPEPESVTPATQFEIPEDVDESVIPFLPAALQERIREKQRLQALHAAAEPAQKNTQAEQEEEGEGGADPLSQPPNSQDDITVWRALPADIRALLRSEHAAEQARLSAASTSASASAAPSAHTSPRKGKEREREKRQTNLPHTPRKAHPNPLPRLPWEHTTPTPSPATTPHKPRPPQTHAAVAGPSRAPQGLHGPILDSRGIDVSSWLFTTGGIDASYFYALPAAEQQHTIALAARSHRAHLAAEAARARRVAAEVARMAGALRLEARPGARAGVVVLADGRRVPVGTVEEVKAFARRVVRGEEGPGGIGALRGVLEGMAGEGAVAEVEEVVRMVGVMVEEEGVGMGGLEGVVEGIEEVVGGRLGGV